MSFAGIIKSLFRRTEAIKSPAEGQIARVVVNDISVGEFCNTPMQQYLLLALVMLGDKVYTLSIHTRDNAIIVKTRGAISFRHVNNPVGKAVFSAVKNFSPHADWIKESDNISVPNLDPGMCKAIVQKLFENSPGGLPVKIATAQYVNVPEEIFKKPGISADRVGTTQDPPKVPNPYAGGLT